MSESSTPPPAVIDPRAMRDVLGYFASGITIITTIYRDVAVGFTCQSFSSLSLDPPLVLFAPGRGSATWPLLREVGSFCVNVLADGHEGLSTAFARSGTDKFAGVSWSRSPEGHPLLDGVAAWLDCTLHAEYDGGDHSIVAAAVVGLGADESCAPLLFHRGQYLRSAPIPG